MRFTDSIAKIRFAITSRESSRRVSAYPALKPAAVMVLLFPDARGELSTVLIRRAAFPGHHSNEISFPGGKYERIDRDLSQTAARETAEELGIGTIDVIAALTPCPVESSGYLIHPYVGVLEETPMFCPSEEVAYPFIVPIAQLLPEVEKRHLVYIKDGETMYESCYFLASQETIIGPTATILDELLETIRNIDTCRIESQPGISYQFHQI